MRDAFEDWFATSELSQDSNSEQKEALFQAFEAGANIQAKSSVPASKLQEELDAAKDKIISLETQLRGPAFVATSTPTVNYPIEAPDASIGSSPVQQPPSEG